MLTPFNSRLPRMARKDIWDYISQGNNSSSYAEGKERGTWLLFAVVVNRNAVVFPGKILDRTFFVSLHSLPPHFFFIGMPALVHQLVYMAKLTGLNARLLHWFHARSIVLYCIYPNICVLDRDFRFGRCYLLVVFCYLARSQDIIF